MEVRTEGKQGRGHPEVLRPAVLRLIYQEQDQREEEICEHLGSNSHQPRNKQETHWQ